GCDHPELVGLAAQLLGTTWIVPNLAAARDLARRLPGNRFVTSAGELVEVDGTITVGTHRAESGLLSRKSELRELRVQLGEALDADLERVSDAWAAASERSEEAERAATTLQAQIAQAETDLRAGEQACAAHAQSEMAAQVALAQIEERRAAAERQRERLVTEL